MPLRPEYPASEKEREVFVQNLPLSIYMDEQLRERFQGSGTIEEVFLLKDDLTQTATGKGYVRFASHASAAACIEANSPGEASGEVTAAWSESERACQRQSSIYGAHVRADAGEGRRALDDERRVPPAPEERAAHGFEAAPLLRGVRRGRLRGGARRQRARSSPCRRR